MLLFIAITPSLSKDMPLVSSSRQTPYTEAEWQRIDALGQHVEALTAYDSALAISPNRLRSLQGAGQAADAAGLSARAQDFYDRAFGVNEQEGTRRLSVKSIGTAITSGE